MNYMFTNDLVEGLKGIFNDKLIDFTLELDFKYDKVFSVIDIDYDEYIKWVDILPFYKNVKKDGVVLWKVA